MRTTVRMRFALLFGAMTLLIGALLLAVVLLIVWQRLQTPDLGPAVLETSDGRFVPMDQRLVAHDGARVEGYLRDTMRNARAWGALALLGTTVIASGAGW